MVEFQHALAVTKSAVRSKAVAGRLDTAAEHIRLSANVCIRRRSPAFITDREKWPQQESQLWLLQQLVLRS